MYRRSLDTRGMDLGMFSQIEVQITVALSALCRSPTQPFYVLNRVQAVSSHAPVPKVSQVCRS